MTETRPVVLDPQPYEPYEDEIELMDLLKVLWKWKYLIIVGTLICAVGAAVVSLNMTKVYGITTVLQPGILKVTDDGKTVYIDSPQNISSLIETGGLNGQVLKGVKFPDNVKPPRSIGFEVTIPKNTNALEVTYETPYVDTGVHIMKNMNQSLLERYGKFVKLYEENYNNEMRTKSNEAFKLAQKVAKVKHAIGTVEAENDSAISEIAAKISAKRSEIAAVEAENEARLSGILNKVDSKWSEISGAEAERDKSSKEYNNRVATTKAQIEAKEKQVGNLQERISDVKSEIGRISQNTDLLIAERNKFLGRSGKQDDILASVIYTNTIQQNISYLNTLRSSVNSITHQIFQENAGIEKLKNDIKDAAAKNENLEKMTGYRIAMLKSDIENLKAQKESLIKQTNSKIENLKADIKDLEAQKESLIKQTRYKVETMQSEIKDLESERELILQEIKSIEFKKQNIENVQVIKPPQVSLGPVKPKTRLNVLLAGVVGLFLTVFLSFFVEYISKYKKRETEE